jgi:hypothetical protein
MESIAEDNGICESLTIPAMKKSIVYSIRTWVFALLLLVQATTLVKAQLSSSSTAPKGFWVVESNSKDPKGSIVRMYTEDARLVYEEHMGKIYLDIKHPKTVALLNAALDEAMIHWTITHLEQKAGNILADLKKRGVGDQLYSRKGN